MNRAYELLALVLLTGLCLLGIPFVLWLSLKSVESDGQTVGIAIGAFTTALPLLINAIRNVGQGQAMQTMVDYLAKAPAVPTDAVAPVNIAEVGGETVK